MILSFIQDQLEGVDLSECTSISLVNNKSLQLKLKQCGSPKKF